MNLFKKKKLKLSCTLFALLGTISGNLQATTEFNDLVIFADSLSYSGIPDNGYGSLRFLPGGSLNPNYMDLISEKFTNKKTRNYLYGGNSYAQPGTKISFNDTWPELQTDKNVEIFLKTNNGKADKNNLYFFAIGGGDINDAANFEAIAKVINFPFFFLPNQYQPGTLLISNKQNDRLLNKKPKKLIKLINSIKNAGAENIIVINVPDASLAPIGMLVHVDVFLSIFNIFNEKLKTSSNIDLNFDAIKEKIGRNVDNVIRPSSNSKPNLHGRQAIKDYALLSYKIQFPFLPRFLGEAFYDTITLIAKNKTTAFNNAVRAQLSTIKDNTNIVYLDMESLFSEIIESPAEYGIDNFIVPSCTLGTSATKCTSSEVYHTDKHYLFSDWFHASEYGHSIMANYFIATYNAPIQVAYIAKQLYGSDIASNLVLANQLNLNRINKINTKFIPFISYSASLDGKYSNNYKDKNNLNNNLNLGFVYNIDDKLSVGSMLTTSIGKYKPYKTFNYKYTLADFKFFTQYLFVNNLWANASVSVGYLKANNINRTIDFGTGGKITENGKTSATSYRLETQLGYDFHIQEDYIITPIAGLNWAKYKTKGYKEEGDRSTSMHFDDFSKDVSNATLGVQFNLKNKPIDLNVELTYNLALNKKDMVVRSAINNTDTSFKRHTDLKNDRWVGVKFGIGKTFQEKYNIGANIEHRSTKDKENRLTYSIVIRGKF